MLVFIDESGDTGRKVLRGSSRFFVVSIVLFHDKNEALLCDRRIELLKHELGHESRFEFHFQDNSEKVRQAFLQTVNGFSFQYFSVVIDKNPVRLVGDGFDVKESFYKFACQMVFSNAKPYLNNATVIFDKAGSPKFQQSLKKYLNTKVNGSSQRKIIKKLKQQSSQSNNLLQLADYVSGVINRKFQEKKNWQQYYRYLEKKEARVQQWPR